jgi:hypothetical protein
MHLLEHRSGLEIPEQVDPKDFMRSLIIGHRYRWTILTEHPILIAFGETTVGDMPELLITGSRSVVISGGNDAYVNRIKSILEMLQRQAHRVDFSKET